MSIIIRDVPLQERPRERFLREGAKALSNQEILAIMLRSGTKQYSALQVAAQLLSTYKTLTALSESSLEEMRLIKGIGVTKAIELAAAMELGKRINREGKGQKKSHCFSR